MSRVVGGSSLLFRRCWRSAALCRQLSSGGGGKRPPGITRALFLGVLSGTALGVGYSFYQFKIATAPKVAILNSTEDQGLLILEEFPKVKVSRRVEYPNDASGLKLVLFQYTTCPFCCKVRSFLDFNGLSYDIIEVNPVMRQQLGWSSYKKVPILLVKTEEGWVQLNDSTMIISAITTYLQDRQMSLKEVVKYYPMIGYVDDGGTKKSEILNRYFLMNQESNVKESKREVISEERKWRKWADDVLVHTLSPNIYRNREEALQAFNWFSQVGQWEDHFSSWERFLVIYVGAAAMYIIGKRLQKRYNLKNDVRMSLYDECNNWMKELNRKSAPFHGGAKPNLADLAVYGVLSSIEGCNAFLDLTKHTKINIWYQRMKTLVQAQAGSTPIHMSAVA